MKKMIFIFTWFFFLQTVFATCDWSTIEEVGGSYVYSVECHVRVGELVQDNDNLKKKIEIKDLVIKYEDERAELWRNRTKDLEQETNYPAYVLYGLGVVSSFISMWAVGQVMK